MDSLIVNSLDIDFPWPPVYTIRRSLRVKRVTLSISVKKGLEIIIPDRLKRLPNIDSLLQERRTWIVKNLRPHLSAQLQRPPLIKPIFLDLAAIQCLVTFSYHYTSHKHIKIQPTSFLNAFQIIGPIENNDLIFQALRQWLKELAKKHLIPWIKQLSDETHLSYSKISIRSQSTLWGSCTRHKSINLNSKLLFLPPHLTRYILIHELCHLKYLNHSKHFWDLVQTFDPHCLLHRKMMKNAQTLIPTWLEID